jgi:protein tyrosine phosphatase (PTP) superfamily phosphohydrolase (DUF442 family)
MTTQDSPSRASAPRNTRRATRLWIWLAAGLLLAGGGFAWFELMPQVEAVTPGRVYKSGALSSGDLLEVVRELDIRTVIDLREDLDDVAAEGATLAAAGVTHVSLPTPQVPSATTVEGFLELMDDETRYPVLIHCEHGYGRAVLFSALFRMEFEGWDNERARCATRSALRLPFSSFDLSEPKGAFLHDYRLRRQGRPEPLGQGPGTEVR